MPQTTYYGIAFIVTVAVSLTLAAVAWRRRSVPGSTYFALMMLSVAWWAFSYAMEALSEEHSLWVQLSTLGDCTMPVFFMLFALSYWRPDIRIRLQYQILIWLIPVATIIIALTNGLHGFLWSEIPPSVENANILLFEHGPWFYVTMIYDFLTLWVGVVFLFRAATSLSKIYRRQALIVLVAAVIPWIANALFLFGFSPVRGLNIAPIMASVTGLLLAFGIVKFQLFKVLPIAKEVVYKQIENGVLVVNGQGILVDINPAAKNMLGGNVEVGQKLRTVLKNRLGLSFPLSAEHQRTEACLDDREKPRWLEVVIAPLYDRRSQLSGHLIMLHDISDLKIAEEAQHRLAVIVESSHDAILSRTLDGIITTWNKGAEMLYGYTAEEAIGRPVSILIPPEFADEGRQFLEKIKRGEAVRDHEAERITKDGKRINVLLTISPIKDMSGRIIGASAIAQNITELRRAAEVVKESEKKYRDLFENANEAIFVAQNEKIVFSNSMLTKMFGYSIAELSAKPFIAFIHPDDRELVVDRHRRRLKGESLPSTYSFRINRKDGSIRWTELSTVVIDWEEKPATLNFLSDITDRRQAEEKVRQVAEEWQTTFDSISDMVSIQDRDYKLIRINKAYSDAVGMKMEDIIGRHCHEVVHNAASHILNCPHHRTLETKKAMSQEIFEPRLGAYLEVSTSPIFDKAGEVIGSVHIAKDISERRRAEEELRKSEKKYRALFDDSVDAVLISTVDGKIVDCNDAMSALTLYSRDELLGLNAIRLYANPADRDRFVRDIQKTGVVKEYEVKWIKKDGAEVDVVMTLTARHDAGGNIVGYQGIVRDVTERKKIEQMKTDFVSFISHQLRTPVAGLMAYIDNMLEGIVGELNGKQIEYLTEMRDVCARGNRLIADLLNVSRLERGILVVNINLVDLRSMVDIAVKEYGQSIKEKGLSLNIQEANRGIVVLADSDKLVEVLKNVIHNAYKFTKAGSISIEISSEGNQGIVKIKDSGIGMTEAMKKDLFKKEKVFGGAIAAGGGAGLGLYIAKGFMKLQGGDIMVESVIGKGSTFIISLPRR